MKSMPMVAIVKHDIPPYQEMNYVMRKLFYEYDASLASDTSLPNSTCITFSHLPIIPYQDPAHFISNLAKVIKI